MSPSRRPDRAIPETDGSRTRAFGGGARPSLRGGRTSFPAIALAGGASIALGLMLMNLAGCPAGNEAGGAGSAGGSSSKGSGAARPAPAPESKRTYTVRAVISALPSLPRQPHPQFHHEEIPDFVARDGKVVGMHEMQMDLPLGPGVSLDGFAVGDAVELDLNVTWESGPGKLPFAVTRLVRLPAGTKLNLKETSAGHTPQSEGPQTPSESLTPPPG